ncbi:hypothetical protein GRF29_1g460978, partial [Pseudopithomyces chartarum]
MTPSKDPETLNPTPSPTHHLTSTPLAPRPFAGRLGANQEFTLPPSTPNLPSLLAQTPDAAPLPSFRTSFTLSALSSPSLYKEASLEAIGTCLQVYLSGLFSIGLASYSKTGLGPGPVATTALASVVNAVLISLFILAGGP